MAKFNNEVRWDLASTYHDELRKVDDTLEFLKESWYSKEEIKLTRDRLISNLQSKLEKEEWYAESKETHRAELKAKRSVREAKEEKQKLQEEYRKKMAEADRNISEKNEAYKDAQISHRWTVGDKAEVWEWVNEDKWLESLRWDREGILNALKENHVKVEKNAEIMWYKWKKVHIDLPEIEWKFGWFKFEYFVSNESVLKRDFESNPELEKKSYSMGDVWGLLWAMNKYMQAMWVETDWDMDYENDLKCWKTDNYRCDAWDCLKQITWLDFWYWLRDKNVDSKKNSRSAWNCNFDYCDFIRSDNANNEANLFLRLY